MKHPGYSKASNQYAGRSPKKLSKEGKDRLAIELEEFKKRQIMLDKKRNRG